jgi:hypothetical protein
MTQIQEKGQLMKKNLLRITVVLIGAALGVSSVFAGTLSVTTIAVGVAQVCEERLDSQGTIPTVAACKDCCRADMPAGSTETQIHLCAVACAGSPTPTTGDD